MFVKIGDGKIDRVFTDDELLTDEEKLSVKKRVASLKAGKAYGTFETMVDETNRHKDN